MGRSIYCSTCRKEKEPGRDNESRCFTCKSEANKKKRALKRQEKGLTPLGSGRSIYCYDCKAVKENPSKGYCRACNRRRDNEWRLSTGRTDKHRTGLCACGNEMAPYSNYQCKECVAKHSKEYRKTHPLTAEQLARRNELQKARKVYKVRKKVRLDPILWEKPKKVKKASYTEDGRKICSRPNCNNSDNLLSNGWCHSCAAAYRREWRKYHEDAPKSEEQLLRHRVRALTRAYIKMGKLIKGSCEVCGELKVDAHHDDYSKPLDIRWLCKLHHREHHKKERST